MGGPGFWLMVAIVALVLAIAVVAASNGLVAARAWIDRRNAERDRVDAVTFGEPTRVVVEDRVDDDARLFGDAAAYFVTARYEAEILDQHAGARITTGATS